MEKSQRGRELVPAAIAEAVALAGATAIYFMDFGLATGGQLPGTTMVTAASAERAGASVVPTVRP
jgi:hypothetical protein